MRILGFKPARFREWMEVLEEEGRSMAWRDWAAVLWKMATVAVRGLFIRDRRWREKMRICGRCPIYDRSMKRCGPWTNSPLGCHCYMPFKAMADNGPCWAKEFLPESGFGWDFSNE